MDAILLAAGDSRRFGENKLFYRIGKKPVYRHVLELLYQQRKENRLGQVVVVSQYKEIFADIRENFPEIEAVENPMPGRGISSSICLGLKRLRQVSEESNACLFAVADQPCLTMESLLKIESLFEKSPCKIAAASQNGVMGNPVIFASEYYGELESLEGDVGGKKVLQRHIEDVGICEIPARELNDLDTPDDIAKVQRGMAAGFQKNGAGRAQKSLSERELTEIEKMFPFLEEAHRVISIVGAGGKTTLMYLLARYYGGRGKTVVATTTTHIGRPDGYPIAEKPGELKRLLPEKRIVVAGADAPENKLTMAKGMGIADYREMADVVLVEADGAKQFPSKVPREGEPVIPKESDLVLGVMGLDALGKPLRDVCFRIQQARAFLRAEEGHCMTGEDMANILASPLGTRKGAGGKKYHVILNKCDDEGRMRQAEEIGKLLAQKGVMDVSYVSLKKYQ